MIKKGYFIVKIYKTYNGIGDIIIMKGCVYDGEKIDFKIQNTHKFMFNVVLIRRKNET